MKKFFTADYAAYNSSRATTRRFALAIGFATFAASILGGFGTGTAQVVSLVPGSVGTAVDVTNGASATLNYTVNSTNAGDVLVVEATTKNLTTSPPTTIAWGSQNLTLAGFTPSINGTNRESAIYYLFDPATGTNNITLNQAGATTVAFDALELTGTDGASVTAMGLDNPNTTNSSVTFTPYYSAPILI